MDAITDTLSIADLLNLVLVPIYFELRRTSRRLTQLELDVRFMRERPPGPPPAFGFGTGPRTPAPGTDG